MDVTITGPNNNELYKQVKKQYDSHEFTATVTGEYKACFSNEFSTFSHKLVYIDFQVGDEKPLPGLGDHITAMTQVKYSKMPSISRFFNVVGHFTDSNNGKRPPRRTKWFAVVSVTDFALILILHTLTIF